MWDLRLPGAGVHSHDDTHGRPCSHAGGAPILNGDDGSEDTASTARFNTLRWETVGHTGGYSFCAAGAGGVGTASSLMKRAREGGALQDRWAVADAALEQWTGVVHDVDLRDGVPSQSHYIATGGTGGSIKVRSGTAGDRSACRTHPAHQRDVQLYQLDAAIELARTRAEEHHDGGGGGGAADNASVTLSSAEIERILYLGTLARPAAASPLRVGGGAEKANAHSARPSSKVTSLAVWGDAYVLSGDSAGVITVRHVRAVVLYMYMPLSPCWVAGVGTGGLASSGRARWPYRRHPVYSSRLGRPPAVRR